MKVWLSPDAAPLDLSPFVFAKAARLQRAHESGAQFLALPVSDLREAVEWALASFYSPLSLVPLPNELSPGALSQRLAQIPGPVVFPAETPVDHLETKPPALKAKSALWAVIFSSGTTGEPKGVALTGAALEASAFAHASHCGAPQASWLLDLPLYHVGGLSVLTRALFLGSNLCLGEMRFSAVRTAQWVKSGLVSGLSLVPTTLRRLLAEPEVPFEKLQLILLGGAPAPAELVSLARERGAPVRLTYGMSEHSSQIATEISPGSGMTLLPGVEVRIAEDDEILVRSPALASGTFRQGRLEPLPLREGFFPTGDLGRLSGRQIEILGRKSEVIITGGKKVFPVEVEGALLRDSSVADAAVLGIDDPEWGEAVCAAIVPVNPASVNWAELKANLRKDLAGYQVPKRWVALSSIPRLPSGKIVRRELKELVLRELRTSRN